MERWGVAISDLHLGGLTSIRPPIVQLGSDSEDLHHGPITAQLWKAWQAAIKAHGSPDFLIVGGDIVNGKVRKDEGVGVWTADLKKQAEYGAALINRWNADVVFVTEGTRYHVDTVNADELAARDVHNAADYHGMYAPPDWNLDLYGAVVHVSHKMGGTKVFQYRGTPLSRELTMNRVMSRETEVFHANLILRGHVHHFYQVRAGANSWCCTIPCWQCRTKYEALENPFVWMPQIGYLVIAIEKGRIVKAEPMLADVVQRAELIDVEEAKRRVKARNQTARR